MYKFENDKKLSKIIPELLKIYELINFVDFHIKTIGSNANKIKNPIWKVKKNNKEVYVMFCEPNNFTELCEISINKIRSFEKKSNKCNKLTWYKMKNKYIGCSKTARERKHFLFIK